MSGPGGGRSGRRPGSADTRGRVLAAARASFAERGFDGATIRDVAARAEVDPALVHHYFGSKQQLFVAAMEFPPELQAAIPALLAGPRADLGERIVGFIVDLWDSATVRPLITGLLRSATTDPVAAAMLRRLLSDGPFLALAIAIDLQDAELRAVLVGTQLIGLAMARYVVAMQPVASMPADDLARAVGPTIQRYLAGDVIVRPLAEDPRR